MSGKRRIARVPILFVLLPLLCTTQQPSATPPPPPSSSSSNPPPPPSSSSSNPPPPPSSKFLPTLSDVQVPFTNVNAPSTFTVVLGHTRPGYDLSRIRFQIRSSDMRLLQNSQISVKLIKGSSSRIISALPTCCSGTVALMANASDVEGVTLLKNYTLRIEPLQPRFGLSLLEKPVVLKTRPLQPTFPFEMQYGHMDPMRVNTTKLSFVVLESAAVAGILPASGISFNNTGASFLEVQGFHNVYMTSALITLVPGNYPADAKNQLLPIDIVCSISDGESSADLTIRLEVHGIPDLSSWCEYSVLRDDTLQGIAGVYGLHWMTLFLMNNHTLLNPADLVPGMRLVLGRPYRVLPNETLFSIAAKFGTTPGVLYAINQPLFLDQQRVYPGTIICVAPGSENVNCRKEWYEHVTPLY